MKKFGREIVATDAFIPFERVNGEEEEHCVYASYVGLPYRPQNVEYDGLLS